MADTTFWLTQHEVEGTLTSVTDSDSDKDRTAREKELLMDYMQSDGAVVSDDSGNWYFGALDIQPDYVLGKFGREYNDDSDAYDEDIGDFVDSSEQRTDADYVMFLIHFERNVLIYNTKQRVRHQMFRKYFSRGFGNLSPTGISLEIEFLYNDDNFEEVVAQQPIYEVSAQLRPTNPGPDPGYEDLDDHMQEMVARKLGIDVESPEDASLNIDEELLSAVLEMSQTEYGEEYRLVYGDDGQVKTISSDADPVTWEEEEPDDLGGLRARAASLIELATAYL
jgi:hypothetical protein